MKNNFNTDDINTDDININNLRNEFKRYIKCGLTVDEAIEKFNIKHCYNDGVEVYRSLCETIELKYVRYIGSITTDQEIESIRKDTKLKELYKKREECKTHIDDLVTEFNNINDEIYKREKCKMNISEDQNKDQYSNTILSAYVKSYVEKLYEADKLLDDLIIDEKGPRCEFQVLSDIIKDLTDAKTALNKYLMVDQINKDLNKAKESVK